MRAAMVLVCLAAACSTPYQRNGFFSFRGGYKDHEIADGRYSIDVQVNGFTSAGTALEYAHRRADELCPSGYDVIDGSESDRPFVYATKDFVTAGSKPEVALVVQCRPAVDIVEHAPPASSKPAARTVRNVVTDTRPIYCTSMDADPSVGLCSRDESKCDDLKIELQTEHSTDFSACTARRGAACFNATTVIDAQRVAICAPSIKDCEARLETARTNPDLTVAASSCGVYRVNTEQVTQAHDLGGH